MDECKKTVGSLLVVYVYILGRKLIAEVITERPLTLKIGEMPEYEGLEVEEFEILEKDSIEFQNNETRSDLLLNHKLAGDAIVCGLERLGVIPTANSTKCFRLITIPTRGGEKSENSLQRVGAPSR